KRFSFPRPMRDEGYEFSLSGLKTAVLRAVRATDDVERDRPHLARAFQDAVLDVLATKLERAVRHTGYRTAVRGRGLARNGPLTITGYGLMMMVAFLMAGWAIQVDLRRRGMNEDYAADIVFAAVVGGIVGAKIWYVLLTGEWDALFRRGGFVWYGGFLGGVAAVLGLGWWRRVPGRWAMELTAAPLALGYALGRVGCFLVND